MKADLYLVSGRVGRWQWPWAVIGTALGAALIAAIAQATTPLEAWLAARFGGGQDDVSLLPGRPDTYAGFLLFALALTLPPALVLALVHRIHPREPLGPAGHWQWGLFHRASLAYLAVMLLGLGVGLVREPDSYRWLDRGLGHLPWVLLAAPVIFCQSFAEEYLFKGYLVRVWGAVLPFRLPIIVIVATLFTSGHAINDDVASDLVFNLIVFFAAEVLTLLVFLRSGSLAAATGLHWLNNLWAMSLVATLPAQSTALAFVSYTDPIVTAGRSRLLDPYSYGEMAVAIGLLWLLLTWSRSPFYLGPPLARAAP